MIGLFFGFLLLVALVPVSVWFVVKCVRAGYVPAVREDFKKRPVFHMLWALASLVCVNGVLTWIPALTRR